ncbi:MAG: redoxin domain-containing protein [Gemmatimonadaceae bacterium]|nr:redoxin domain-containing protein [Gemmatimonadaceae bacterium]
MTSSDLLAVGTRAPEFVAVDHEGVARSLSDLLERGHVALFFYPGNNTPG